jgi:hypothetical protein
VFEQLDLLIDCQSVPVPPLLGELAVHLLDIDCLGEPLRALLLSPWDEDGRHALGLLPAPRACAPLPVSGGDRDGLLPAPRACAWLPVCGDDDGGSI